MQVKSTRPIQGKLFELKYLPTIGGGGGEEEELQYYTGTLCTRRVMSCIITLLQVHNLRASQEVPLLRCCRLLVVHMQFIILIFNYFPLLSQCPVQSPNHSFLQFSSAASTVPASARPWSKEPFYLQIPSLKYT